MNKGHDGDHDGMPKLQLTEVSNELFDSWVQEIKQEEHVKLMEARAKTDRDKKLRQQELALRSKMTAFRAFIISTIIKASISPVDISTALKAKLESEEGLLLEFKAGMLNPNKAEEVAISQKEFKSSVVSEQKRTRKLFECACEWAKRIEREGNAAAGTDKSPVSKKRRNSGILRSQKGDKSARSHNNDDDNNVEEEEGEGAVNEEDEGPTALKKDDLFRMLRLYYQQQRDAANALLVSKKASSQSSKATSSEPEASNKSSNNSTGNSSSSSKAISSAASAAESKFSASIDILNSYLEQTATSEAQAAAVLGQDELATLSAVNWVQTICATKPEFLRVLLQMDTSADGKFARDELVQFAAILVEVEPHFSAVVDEYRKAKEEAIAAAALRKKRKQQRIDNKIKEQEKKLDEERTARELAVELQHKLDQQQAEAEAFDLKLKEKYSEGLYNAHQHRFVPIPQWNVKATPMNLKLIGKEAKEFCPICVEKRYDLWLQTFIAAEKQRAKFFDGDLQDELQRIEGVITEEVEAEYEEYLYVNAEQTNFFNRKRAEEKERRKLEAQRKKNMRGAFIGKFVSSAPLAAAPVSNASAAVAVATAPAEGDSAGKAMPTGAGTIVASSLVAEIEVGKSAVELATNSVAAEGSVASGSVAAAPVIVTTSVTAAVGNNSNDINTSSNNTDTQGNSNNNNNNNNDNNNNNKVNSKGKSRKAAGASSRSDMNVLTEPLTVDLLDELLITTPLLLSNSFTDALRTTDFCALPPALPWSHVMIANRPNAPIPLLMSGLSLFSPDGKCLVPEPEPEPEPDVDLGSVSVKSSENDDGGDELPLGVKVRVWDLDMDTMLKGKYLGHVKITYDEMMNPPKGFRAYPLQDEEQCRLVSGMASNELPSGTITLRVSHFSKDKETNEPTIWKVEVIRCTGLLVTDKTKKSSNPFCEIFWKGPAEKHEKGMLFTKWIKVGETKVKYNCIDPVYNRSDKTEYELPPVWTDLDAEGRGPHGDFLSGGCWVSRNNVPNAEQVDRAKEKTAKMLKRSGQAGGGTGNAASGGAGAAGEVLTHADKMMHAANLAVTNEIRNRIEMMKLLITAEERERRQMASEEKLIRKVQTESMLVSVRTDLDEQVRLGRLFTTMLERMRKSSVLLQRMRFHSAKQLDSGGMRIVTKDPTDNKRYYVNITPILYPEDEEEMERCCSALIGSQHPAIIRLVEFAFHQIRGFNVEGFPTINERFVFAIFENIDNGVTLPEYIHNRWESIDNEDFKCILKQVLNGIKFLHSHDILHRNLHANSVKVYEIKAALGSHSKEVVAPTGGLKATISSKSRSSRDIKLIANVSAAHTHKLRNNLVCKLEDFWFLSNPRKVHCAYSLGRNDWGSGLTPPPEVVSGSVSQASDIYAFGMCVLEWASNMDATLHHRNYPSIKGIDELKRQIPLKWSDWVHDVIRQCLQPDPSGRPSAEELIEFLNDPYNE